MSDGRGGSGSATVIIAVAPVNDPPVAVDDHVTTKEETPVAFGVIDGDSGPEAAIRSSSRRSGRRLRRRRADHARRTA
ncbi:MAG: Ig-like domain-containing protein [Desulfobacterales bacterium]|nr:Ig-like domain-containing protein [Desulfobacterales bacterium]